MRCDFSINKDEFYPGKRVIYTYYFSLWGAKFYLNPDLVDSPEKIGESLPDLVSIDDFSNYLRFPLRKNRSSIKGLWGNFVHGKLLPRENVINWIYNRVYN